LNTMGTRTFSRGSKYSFNLCWSESNCCRFTINANPTAQLVVVIKLNAKLLQFKH
jgi:hypothetical protein